MENSDSMNDRWCGAISAHAKIQISKERSLSRHGDTRYMFPDMHFSAETKIFFMHTKNKEETQKQITGVRAMKRIHRNVNIANIILFCYSSRVA